MHFVLIGDHNIEACPTSNAEVRGLVQESGPHISTIADKAGVTVVAGPYVSREHTTVIIVEAATAEAVDQFLVDTKLHQWNRWRVVPSLALEDALGRFDSAPPIF